MTVAVQQTPAGWWQVSHVPRVQFLDEQTARAAATLPEADALTLYFASRTLAKGDRLVELVAYWKAVDGLPYTAEERAWVDGRLAARAPLPRCEERVEMRAACEAEIDRKLRQCAACGEPTRHVPEGWAFGDSDWSLCAACEVCEHGNRLYREACSQCSVDPWDRRASRAGKGEPSDD